LNKPELDREVAMLAAASMLTYLKYMREDGKTTLSEDVLHEFGCTTMHEYFMKLRFFAAHSEIDLPDYVKEYMQ